MRAGGQMAPACRRLALLGSPLVAIACAAAPLAPERAAVPEPAPAGPPLILVTPDAVLLDGKAVAAALDPSADPSPIPSLAQALRGRAAALVRLRAEPSSAASIAASAALAAAGDHRAVAIESSGGTVLLRDSGRQGQWSEPGASIELLMMVGPTHVTMIAASGAGTGWIKHRLVAREPVRPVFEQVRGWVAELCAGAADGCPRAHQVRMLAPMTSAEWLALITAASPKSQPGQPPSVLLTVLPSSPGKNLGMPRFVVQQVVAQYREAFLLCHREALSRDANATGRVVTRVTVTGDGSVSEVQDATATLGGGAAAGPGAHQGLRDDKARACVADAWRKVRFPEPQGGPVTFAWPTFFSPGPREQVDEELR